MKQSRYKSGIKLIQNKNRVDQSKISDSKSININLTNFLEFMKNTAKGGKITKNRYGLDSK